MDIFNDIKQRFKLGSLLTKLVMVNVGVFLVIRLIGVVLTLFDLPHNLVLLQLELPANLSHLVMRPWSIITYMFLHYDLLHLLFNMLWLFGFGQLFLYFFNEKQLGGLYLLGGLFGAIFYLLAYNTLPYFADVTASSLLLGASSAVIAIVVATAVYAPNYKVRMMLIGELPLKYIALATILIDLLSVVGNNAGGHIAHLGGAVVGILFGYQLHKGRDITKPINRLLDGLTNLFKPHPRRPKMKVNYHSRPESDTQYRERRAAESAEIDHILDKVKRSGYGGLSTQEKKRLFEASKK